MSFSDFFQQNIVMFVAALGLLGFLVSLEIKKLRGGVSTISPAMLSRIANDGGKIIDIRKAEDYKKGHIPGAKNIPVDNLESRLGDLGKKENDIVLYCYAGKSSATALALLQKNGFTNAKHLGGGMNTWLAENMPIGKNKA